MGTNKKISKYSTIIIFICIISSFYSGRKLWGHINIKPSISEVIRRKVVQEKAKYLLIPPSVDLGIQPFQVEVIKDFSELTPLETMKSIQNTPDAPHSYVLLKVIKGTNLSDTQIQKYLTVFAIKKNLKPLELLSSYKTGKSQYIALVRLGLPKK